MNRPTRPRRSFVIIAVLVIVAAALLVATSLLFLVQAEAAAASGAAASAQARALAWSGMQVAMQRLDEQRDLILDGELPELDDEYLIYETDTRLGVVRLLPVGPDGARLVPEAGRLDVNTVDADMLVATGLVDDATARAIISYRDNAGRPLASVEELLRVPGLSPRMLYGPIEEMVSFADIDPDAATLAERVESRLGDSSPRGLADVLTVFSVEPPLQRSGDLRINLNTPWSEELGRRVADRFGEQAAAELKRLFDQGSKFESDGDICRTMQTVGVPLEDWPEPVDTFTAETGDYLFGRLDINSAPYEALLALPGLEPEQAAQTVRAREDLGPEDRATIVWPATEGIIDTDTLVALAGRLTTRSWTYRLRLAAGEVSADEPDAPIDNPLVYEVVVDLAAPSPRLAMIRDVTLLETAALIAAAMPAGASDEEFADLDVSPDGAATEPGDAFDDAPSDDLDDPLFEPGDPMDETELDDEPGAAAPSAPTGAAPSSGDATSERAAATRRRTGRWRSG